MQMLDSLKCVQHPKYPVQFVNLNEDSQNKLRCCQCLSDQRDYQMIISIDQIQQSDEMTCFQIWPPLKDEVIREKVKKLILVEDDLFKQIESYFDGLLKEITQVLQESKKMVLVHCQTIQDFKYRIKSAYQHHSSVSEMKELFNKNLGFSELNEQIKLIINSRYQVSQEESSYLKNLIDYYEEINIFDSRYRDYDSQKIKDIIQNIKFFYPNSLKQELSNEQFESLFKVPEIFKGIQQTALINILDRETKVKNLLKQIQNDFCLLSDWSNISNFSQDIIESVNQFDSFQKIDSLEQEESQMLLDQIPQWLSLGRNINNKEKILKVSEGINESTKQKLFISNGHMFFISKVNNSQGYLKNGCEENGPSLLCNQISPRNLVYGYFSMLLKPQSKYIIRIQKIFQQQQGFSLGLVQQGNENISITGNSEFFKSGCFSNSEVNNDYKFPDNLNGEFQIEINISHNKIEISDYPSKQNIFKGKSSVSYQPNANHYFFIGYEPTSVFQKEQLFYKQNKFILIDFQELNNSQK